MDTPAFDKFNIIRPLAGVFLVLVFFTAVWLMATGAYFEEVEASKQRRQEFMIEAASKGYAEYDFKTKQWKWKEAK